MAKELLKHLFKKPATLKYPFEKKQPHKGLRGRPTLDLKLCVGCGLCHQDCPSGAIEMISKGLQAEFKLYLGRCIFCGQCAEVCPRKAIAMTQEYELDSYGQDELIIEFKR